MARLAFWILLVGLAGSEIQDALAQRFPIDTTATSVSTSSAASTITTTQGPSTTSLSIAGVSTPSASSASGTDSMSPTSTLSTSVSSTAAEASNTAANSTLMEDVKSNGSGVSSGAKVGVGIGVGVGIPLLAAILTAIFLIRKRRKRSLGPYGPVTTNDKGVGESSSFHSPSTTHHELRNVGSKAPFLPPIPAQETSLQSPDQDLSPSAAEILARHLEIFNLESAHATGYCTTADFDDQRGSSTLTSVSRFSKAGAAVAYAAKNLVEGAALLAKGVYDPTLPLKATLQPIKDVEVPQAYHTISVIKGRAHAFGGKTSSKSGGEELADNDMHVIILPASGVESTDYRRIEATEGSPPRRWGHSAAVVDDRIYVFGGSGQDDGEPIDEQGRVWVFNTATNV
ncbi:hypothetical protein KC316_g14923, partial [Hortaea werneckii]